MRLNILAFAVTTGLLWGGALFMVAVAALIWPGYGRAFLELAASLYPGYQPVDTFGLVITGTLYGVVDGSAGGALFAWLYNTLSRRFSATAGGEGTGDG